MNFRDEIEKIGLPAHLATILIGFCEAYAEAVKKSQLDPKKVMETFSIFLSCVMQQMKKPYPFLPYHKALTSPIDYYKLGLDFVRPLIDFKNSKVLGIESLDSIQKALDSGENVVLLSNHQTEIDPQIISLLIEKEHAPLAYDMTFVAGHLVTTDPLAVPLSMGRNLICIYSKRHIDHPPEKRAEKLAQNQKALKALSDLFDEGGHCIYIAPSGGRDRRNENDEVVVAHFDSDSIELFNLLAQKAKKKVRFHTLALSTYPLLPPPHNVLQQTEGSRHTHFSPAYLVFGPEIDMETVGSCDKESDKKKKRSIRAHAIWQHVVSDYKTVT
jgi:glycerol-3-phosphate O-acyltransferase